MSSNEPRTSVSRGTPLDAARESLVNTPLWLPVSVAVLSVVVLDIVVPRGVGGATAAVAVLAGIVLATASVALVVYRFMAKSRVRTLLRSLTTAQSVAEMTAGEVHDLVVAALLRRGWHLSPDMPGGAPADVVVMTSERVRRAIFFVSTKSDVTAASVRELEATVRGRARALLVTGGSFAPEAIVFARQIGVELVDGQGVLTLMTELRGEANTVGPLPAPTFVWEDEVLPGRANRTSAADAGGEKRCPDCGSTMKAHQNSATRYWACSRFPDCSGMIIIQ